MRRRLALFFGLVVAVLVLSAATLPWWFGGVLRWAGASRGLTFARYETVGYARFALSDVEVKLPGVRVTVTRIEADTPLLTWWRGAEAVLGTWSVEVTTRTEAPTVSNTARGWLPLRGLIGGIATPLERWAPRLRAASGVVRWPGQEIKVSAVDWAKRRLKVDGLSWRELQVDGTLDVAGNAWRLELTNTDGAVAVTSEGADLKGDVTWWGQRAELSARFAEQGWMPREAVLAGDAWSLPGTRLKLGDTYEAVKGRAKIEWRAEKWTADVAVNGVPLGDKKVPPLALIVRGQGDADAMTVDAVEVTWPGLVARLSAPVTVERSGKFRASGARFTVEADLAKQPWLAATGVVRGEARWVETLAQEPVVEFQLGARDVAAAEWNASVVEAKGRLAWPRLTVSEGTLTGTAGETLTWRGGWDFKTKEMIDVVVEGQLRRATVARWLPAAVGFDVVTVQMNAAGPGAAPVHAGRVQAAAVRIGELNSAAVSVTWTGRGVALEAITAEVTAGTTTVAAKGVTSGESVRLDQLTLVQGGVERWALAAPATVRWRPAIAVEGLRLVGPESALSAAGEWGAKGRIEVSAKNVRSAWLSDFGVWSGPAWQVTTLAATATWDGGPMTWAWDGAAEIELGAERRAVVAAKGQGDGAGVRLEELSVREGVESVVTAVGKIPVRFTPGAAVFAEFEAGGALALDVKTVPHAVFWKEWATLTGVELVDPQVTAQLTGTWARPRGTARVSVGRMAMDSKRFARAMPTVEGLEIALNGDSAGVQVERLVVKVEGQEVRATGRLPVPEGKWSELVRSPLAWAQRGGEGRIEIPDADVAALARFLPAMMAPKGRVQVDLSYGAGALSGAVQVREAATRLLGPLGVLQEITADVAFAGRKMELRKVTAQSGGQTVVLGGSVEWPDWSTAKEGATALDGAKFDVTLKGENLPFVRQTGVLVRGDVDLTLTSPARGVPRIAGKVRLRESLFLSDLRALLPGGTRSKARTPPYFAVELAPYDAWGIAMELEGEEFLKLRTTLFSGLASARFQLTGTLGEPVMRGEATIDEGTLKLPFAAFAVQEGRVSLTPEQGLDPQLWLVGTVRRMNYDLRVEASGPASAPNVLFSSSPPLESGQVLLMVMTGESPRDDLQYSTRQRATRLGAFLGQSLLAGLGNEGEDGEERLSLSSGEAVSRQGRETYGFEYRLSERWSVVGEYDEFDDFNAGLKWRVWSKGGTKDQPKAEAKK